MTDYAETIREVVRRISGTGDVPAVDAALASLEARIAELRELLDTAWVIICNAGEGDWTRESAEWQDAAVRFREKYHANLDGRAALAQNENVGGAGAASSPTPVPDPSEIGAPPTVSQEQEEK